MFLFFVRFDCPTNEKNSQKLTPENYKTDSMRNQLADLEKSKYNEDKLKKEGLFEFFDGSATISS